MVCGQALSFADVLLSVLRQLAVRGVHARVVALEYSLSPESVFPVALNQV